MLSRESGAGKKKEKKGKRELVFFQRGDAVTVTPFSASAASSLRARAAQGADIDPSQLNAMIFKKGNAKSRAHSTILFSYFHTPPPSIDATTLAAEKVEALSTSTSARSANAGTVCGGGFRRD